MVTSLFTGWQVQSQNLYPGYNSPDSCNFIDFSLGMGGLGKWWVSRLKTALVVNLELSPVVIAVALIIVIIRLHIDKPLAMHVFDGRMSSCQNFRPCSFSNLIVNRFLFLV